MNYINRLFFIGMAIATLVSCRSTKTIQTAIAKKDTTHIIPVVDLPHTRGNDSMRFIQKVLDTIHKNYIDFQTFNAKIKVDFEGGDGRRNDFNAFVRLKKDSILWITINAALGFDAFRVKVTPDSVIVINKLNKTVQMRSVEYLQEVTKIPITFSELQSLIIGNPVFLDSNISSYKNDEKSISLISIGTLFKHFLSVNKDDYTLQHSKLDDVDASRARTADITYDDYQYSKSGVRFSAYRRITVSEKSKLDIEMQYKQFDFNADLSFPFNIPRNYKRQ